MSARVYHQSGNGILAARGVMEEVEELERAAEWRMRKVDADPSDDISRHAAVLLQKLADDVRQLQGSAVLREYTAICNWLAESDDIVDFSDMATDYRARIGLDRMPQDGQEYLRDLVELAKRTFGAA